MNVSRPIFFFAQGTRRARAGLVGAVMLAWLCAVAPAAETPTSISNCVLWLDASKITGLSDGAQVDTWTDASGNSNNAARNTSSMSGYPQYKVNVLNGNPVVRFSNPSAPNWNSWFDFTSRRTDIRTVFWVLKEMGTIQLHELLGDSSSYDFDRGGSGNLWSSFASLNIRNGTTRLMGTAVTGTTTPLDTGYRLVSVVTIGSVSANRISRDRDDPSNIRSWDGDIAEIIIYNRALTPTEENQVGYYLSRKYALTTSYTGEPQGMVLTIR